MRILKLFEVTIVTNSEAVDALCNYIEEMDAYFSIQDSNDLFNENICYTEDTIIDKDVFESEDVLVKAYFSDDIDIELKMKQLNDYLNNISQFVNVGKRDLSFLTIEQNDWENEWKKFYKPTKIGKTIVVKPLWEEYEARKGEIILEIDPGLAFGTGTHETTSMCMIHLENYINNNCNVLDIGCGSGILSICSSKLGAKSIFGIDIDGIAIKVSKENAQINNVNNIDFAVGDLFKTVSHKYDIIIANIVADIIIRISESIKDFLNENGIFISSGIIKERKNEVEDVLINNGFKILEIMQDGEWISFVAKKNN